MILLDDFIKGIKRENQYGDETVVNDEPTLDIVRQLNYWLKRIAKKKNWSWLLKTFSVTVTANAQDITLDSTIDRVEVISDGNGKELQKITPKEAVRWHTPAQDETDSTYVGYFIDLGVDTSGNKKIRVFGTPQGTGVLTAYGMQKVEDISIDDIGTGANLLPVPDDILALVQELVSAKIQKTKGNANWILEQKKAEDELFAMIGESESDPSATPTTKPPNLYRLKKRMRRAGKVV